MTPEEHMLAVTMLARMYQQIKVFIEILRSRELLDGDDAIAFAALVHTDTPSNASLFQEAAEFYLAAAKKLGVETGLESPPPSL